MQASSPGWAADSEFCRHAGWAVDLPVTERVRLLRVLIRCPPPELIRLGVIHNGRLVGYIDLHGGEPDRRELGFLVGERSQWGRGLGRSAAAAGLDHGFDQLGLTEVWAEALDANRRSIHILRRLGLTETGTGDKGRFLDQPSYYRLFAITSRDWARCREEGRLTGRIRGRPA
jgi:RimJ/RimL family protein N-acetyltransferase